MAFGQQSGPPATARQVQELTSLVVAAGHADFRDARGPLGLTQRQAAGRFTRDEADALIERLEREAVEGPAEETTPVAPSAAPAAAPPRATRARRPAATGDLRAVPSEQLAAELQRRGWIVMEP